jgi:RNA polymerase sigma-70 factor (ECF subfamily)
LRFDLADVELARRLVAGDEAAFDEFFADYFPRLSRFAVARLGGNDDAAEEVVQSSLIRALQKMHTYRGEAALFSWLCTICRREIFDRLEREGRAHEWSLAEDDPAMRAALDALAVSAGADAERKLEQQESQRLVQIALDHLPKRYRDALQWKYVEDLSVAEIGERLGLGYKAAESTLTRARNAFREGFIIASTAGGDR